MAEAYRSAASQTGLSRVRRIVLVGSGHAYLFLLRRAQEIVQQGGLAPEMPPLMRSRSVQPKK